MKKLMIASAIAMMCFSANAFAEDDGYGNEVPSAWNDGTVDDGYGNKLPSNQSEYKSFGEARAAAGNNQSRQFNIGGHFDLGIGGYWNYPDEFAQWMGDNSWISISFDLGGVFKYRINNMLSVVPEVSLGFTHTSRKVDEYYDGRDIDETRMLFNINIPVTARVTPMPYFYAEAGFRLNFNLATSHTLDLASSGDYYDDSRSLDLDKWKASTVVPSLVVGLGGTIRSKNHDMDLGLRFVLDLTTIEEDDTIYWKNSSGYLSDSNGKPITSKIETKQWAIQFVMNYYLF